MRRAENKIHSVQYNFLMNFLLTASNLIFSLITFPYISRVLLATGSGKVEFAASVANYFLLVASLGIPTYGIRACAQVREDKDKLSKTVQELLVINAVTTALVILTYLAGIVLVPRFRADKTLFLINGVGIILNMLGVNWFYQALEKYDYITVRTVVFKVISLILMFVFVRETEDYLLYGGITVFANVGSNILNFCKLRQYVSLKKKWKYSFRPHMKPIFVLFAQSVAVSVYTNLDTVMLGFMKTDYDVGLYTAAVKVKGMLVTFVTSLGNVLLPRMSYYAKNKMCEDFSRATLMAVNFTLLLSLPLAAYFILAARDCILFLAGSGFLGAVVAMQIITVAIVPVGLTGVLGVQVLISLEKEKYVLYSVLTGAAVDFVLNCFWIPSHGAAGAAFATVVAEFFVLLVQLVHTRTIVKPMLKKIRILPYVLASAVGCGSYLLVGLLNIQSLILRLAVTACAFFGAYGICLLLFREPILLDTARKAVGRLKGKSDTEGTNQKD